MEIQYQNKLNNDNNKQIHAQNKYVLNNNNFFFYKKKKQNFFVSC